MRRLSVLGIFLAVIGADGSALAQTPDHLHDAVARRVYEGPPLSLKTAIDEALERNPASIALRSQFDAVRQRPAQERFLMPPTFEAEIWQVVDKEVEQASNDTVMRAREVITSTIHVLIIMQMAVLTPVTMWFADQSATRRS